VPKIIKVGVYLTKLCQQQFGTVFLRQCIWNRFFKEKITTLP